MEQSSRYRIYVCGNVHCSARGRDAILAQLNAELWKHKLDSEVQVIVSGCQNRCEHGPNLTIWPGPFRYTLLTPDAISRIVMEHLIGGEPVRPLLYRDSVTHDTVD